MNFKVYTVTHTPVLNGLLNPLYKPIKLYKIHLNKSVLLSWAVSNWGLSS